jgi:hypothetical protein
MLPGQSPQIPGTFAISEDIGPFLFQLTEHSTAAATGPANHNITCPYTVFTEPEIQAGPTSTWYSLTVYTSSFYNCRGCKDAVVIPLGHIFPVRYADSSLWTSSSRLDGAGTFGLEGSVFEVS